MNIRRILLISCIGLLSGVYSTFCIFFMVQTGILFNKGVVGLVSFPIYEELIKMTVSIVIIHLFNHTFEESLIQGIMCGYGFRVIEMSIKDPGFLNFIVPALLHAGWVCIGLVGILHYRDFQSKKKLWYIILSIGLHLLWNVYVT